MVKQIGWYTLSEDTVFTDNGYECAAWYERIKVPAGKYPILVHDYKVMHFDDEARRKYNGEVDGHIGSGYIPMEGTIESDYFGSMYGGVPVGEYDTLKNAGRSSTYTMHVRFYELAGAVIKGDSRYELLPEYEARVVWFEYDGEMHSIEQIYVREEA